MTGILSEIRHGFRLLRNSAASTVVAVLSLAAGIGANSAIFSVGNAMLLRALAYPDADRLVALRSGNPARGLPDERTAVADLRDWQTQTRSFEAIAGYRWRTVDLTGADRSERLRGLAVTREFFDVFRIRSMIGRTFTGQEQSDGSRVMVLGRGLWLRRFGSDPDLIGKPLDVNVINLNHVGPTQHTIVGIVTTDVHFPPLTADFQLGASSIEETVDFWTPVSFSTTGREGRELDVIARLRPGVTVVQAQAEMDTIAHDLADAYPASNRGWGVAVVPLRDHVLGSTRRALLLLSVCTGLVLLIACGNVANLLMARGIARRKEVAIRAALGAGRFRIARQFLLESALIALLSGGVGILLTFWGIGLLLPFTPPAIPLARGVTIDATVLGFTLLVSSITALMTGIVPAVRLSRANPAEMIRVEGRTASRERNRIAGALVASEVAMTIVLLIGTGLMVKSAAQLWQVDPGFDPHNLLTMTISLPNNKFDWKHNVVFSRQVIESVKAMAQVRNAAVIQGVPMRSGSFQSTLEIEGKPAPPPAERPVTRIRVVSPGYFQVMKIPILSGREFNERDELGKIGIPPYVVVSRTLAERHWPGQDAVGKKMRTAPNADWFAIVGVAGDVRYAGLDRNPDPELYFPEGLFPQAAITLLVRTEVDPSSKISEIRTRIHEIDQEAFVTDIKPMSNLMTDSVSPRRFSTMLLILFASVALVLALTGIYSVISHAVVQRRIEIGIRMALGADRKSVVGLMVRHGVLPAVGGIGLGLAGAFMVTRFFSAMLFEVRPLDTGTWIVVSLLMLAVSALASYIPARKASAVDPSVALRPE